MAKRTVKFADLVDDKVLEIGAGRPRSAGMHLPVLRVADVLDGRIQPTTREVDPPAERQHLGPKTSRPGDLVLTTKGTVGRVAVMPSTGPVFAYSPQLCYFRLLRDGILDCRYLYYWFKSAQFWTQANALKSQTDMADFISLQDVHRLAIELPDINEQHAISEVLGALDEKMAANDRVAATARKLARAIYDYAVACAVTVPMSSVLDPFLGGTPSRSDPSLWNGTVPWVSAKDITGAPHGVIIETAEGIAEVATRTRRLSALPPGTAVLTARGTVGAVARLGIASAINQSCYAFVPGLIPAASLVFVVEDASAQAKAMAHGSVFDTITMRTFDHVQVPSLASDQWSEVEARLAPLLAVTQQAVTESALLIAGRDELLPLLMSGKIRITDAEKTVEGVL